MKLFVTGSTGFVGKQLVRKALQEKRFAVRALVRSSNEKGAQELKDWGAEIAVGDVMDPTSLKNALADGSVDAVAHLVGIIKEKRSQGITFDRLIHLATRHMVDATKNAGIERFLHMSALGTRPNAESPYHIAKWNAEEYVRASGLKWTMFRPSIISGKEDLFMNRFALFMKYKVFGVPLPRFGVTKFQPVYVDDVAEAFLRAATNDASIGKMYDVVGPDTVSLRQLTQTISKVSGRWAPPIPMPMWYVSLMAKVLQYAPYPFDLNPAQVTMMKIDNTGDIEPMKRDLGIVPIGFEEGLRRFMGNE